MTTEVIIMNRQAIALAADSAVTVGKKRVWKGMNKLFSLGPVNDIAIMVYNGADFIGYPWEIIIKSFRSENGDNKFKSVSECADRFVSFLKEERFDLHDSMFKSQLIFFVDEIENFKKYIGNTKGKLYARKKIREYIEKQHERLNARKKLEGFYSFSDFCHDYKDDFLVPLIKEAIGKVPDSLNTEIIRFLYEMWSREFKSSHFTGVVIAGYGSMEYFPSVVSLAIDCKDRKALRWWRTDDDKMSISVSKDKSMVLAFGQGDITQLFMEGTERSARAFIGRILSEILDNKSERLIKAYISSDDERIVETARQKADNKIIVDSINKEIEKFGKSTISNQILDVVRVLPKEELAAMARALVEVTALRRKMDSSIESVGGPVDVAVISKGDGLIWIDRKHYFELSKNSDFLDRKRKQRRHGDE